MCVGSSTALFKAFMYSFSDLAKIIFVEIKKIWFAPQIFFDVEKLGVFGELCTMDRLLLHMSQFCS